MASRSARNIISIISLCAGTAIEIEKQVKDRPKNKTVMALVRRAKVACEKADDLWKIELDEKELTRVALRNLETEKALYVESNTSDVSVWTSLCLALLDELYGAPISSTEKLEVLDGIHRTVSALHRYYDKTGKRWNAYKAAGRAADKWRELAA